MPAYATIKNSTVFLSRVLQLTAGPFLAHFIPTWLILTQSEQVLVVADKSGSFFPGN